MSYLERVSSLTENKQTNEWFEWIRAIVIAVLLAFLLRTFIMSTSVVDGDSMYPVLEDGERVLFNKIIYNLSEPARGDIVIIQHLDKNYVKRIIGLPNETIEMRGHTLYIDGEAQSTSFIRPSDERLTGDFGPIAIPENKYFVMGDNRAISYDSRHELGFIDRTEIVGRSEFIIYPFKEMEFTR